MYKRILLAYDGSEAGQKALLDCGDLANLSGAELSLIAVMPLHMGSIGLEVGVYDQAAEERERERYQAILNAGLARLSAAGHKVSGELVAGDSVSEITRAAKKIDADLIVVGHKHLEGWAARWWQGAISGALIEHAHCSVLVSIIR
ncbi:universal stress protein [Pseudorhodoferax sp. Leaf267]|uniref:universal stress protein n=1 Tax=Pseudorhodoferax sp. Leaf267 TaxID=1736316 RepID=UPI0006F329CA|nr:universal stress protein [Pseudorhodoferax sp. Leaf267]KQP23504.1 universal stress protein [Pseudorhodoferax sp. Leaf267]